ncbi:MAG: hypothetical protein ACK4RK_15400 [Gemmataceae bacterium]
MNDSRSPHALSSSAVVARELPATPSPHWYSRWHIPFRRPIAFGLLICSWLLYLVLPAIPFIHHAFHLKIWQSSLLAGGVWGLAEGAWWIGCALAEPEIHALWKKWHPSGWWRHGWLRLKTKRAERKQNT